MMKIRTNEFGHMIKWPPRLNLVKILTNLPIQKQLTNDLETWYEASGTQVLPKKFKCCPCADTDLVFKATLVMGKC